MRLAIIGIVIILLIAGCQTSDSSNTENNTDLDNNGMNNVTPKKDPKEQKSTPESIKISECKKIEMKEGADIEIGDTTEINHAFNYDCCAELKASYKIENQTLKLYYDNKGETCSEKGTYIINASIKSEDIEKVKIYGIRYFDKTTGIEAQPYKLMTSYPHPQNLTKCIKDEDCVPKTCCHPRECVLKTEAPDCEGTSCTLECKGGTLDCGQGWCVCMDGQCQVEWRN